MPSISSEFAAACCENRRDETPAPLGLRCPAVAIRHGTCAPHYRRRIRSRSALAPSMHHSDAERRSFAMNELDQRMSSRRATNNKDTGTAETDENYDLVSILYHCLKAADACTQYIADAEDAADDELAEFFENARLLQNRLAREARELLAERMSEAASPSDEES
jgi:hypothetical protein